MPGPLWAAYISYRFIKAALLACLSSHVIVHVYLEDTIVIFGHAYFGNMYVSLECCCCCQQRNMCATSSMHTISFSHWKEYAFWLPDISGLVQLWPWHTLLSDMLLVPWTTFRNAQLRQLWGNHDDWHQQLTSTAIIAEYNRVNVACPLPGSLWWTRKAEDKLKLKT